MKTFQEHLILKSLENDSQVLFEELNPYVDPCNYLEWFEKVGQFVEPFHLQETVADWLFGQLFAEYDISMPVLPMNPVISTGAAPVLPMNPVISTAAPMQQKPIPVVYPVRKEPLMARRVKDHDVTNAFEVLTKFSKIIAQSKTNPIARNRKLIDSIHYLLGALRQIQNESANAILTKIVIESKKKNVNPAKLFESLFKENLNEDFKNWFGGIKHGIKNMWNGWKNRHASQENETIQKWTQYAISALERLETNPRYQQDNFKHTLNQVLYQLKNKPMPIPETPPESLPRAKRVEIEPEYMD